MPSPEELLREFREALNGPSGDAVAGALLAELKNKYGEAPLVARMLSRNPSVYVPAAMKNAAIIRESPLGTKVAELLAVASAAALRCDHCLKVHIRQAMRAGATEDEVFSAILVAGAIAESSTHAYAFRALSDAARGRDA